MTNLATIARYFRVGIEVGIIEVEDVRAWAFSVIEAEEAPPCEVIDVSWNIPRAQLIEALNLFPGEVDIKLAGNWLLAVLRELLPGSNDNLKAHVQCAMQIAYLTELGDSVYFEMDAIDDGIFLALSEAFGTIVECRNDFENALAGYTLPSFQEGYIKVAKPEVRL
jgi:hypothetical protein